MWTRLLAIAAVVAAAAACSSSEKSAAVVPADTPPADIVRMYLTALDAHDLTTAREVLSAKHADEVEQYADSWFRNIDSITNITTSESVAPPGGRQPGFGYRETTSVRAEFDLRQKEIGSFSDGHNSWGYVLGRDSASEHWRIISEGNG